MNTNPRNSKAYVGDVGTIIILDCGTSIADGTAFKIKCLKPNATSEVTWNGTLYLDRHVKYVVQAGDFSIKGTYYLQAYVETASGKWRGETVALDVFDPFK